MIVPLDPSTPTMSDIPVPPAYPVSPRPYPAGRQQPARGSALRTFFVLSLLLNIFFFFVLVALCAGAYFLGRDSSEGSTVALRERHRSGSTGASEKVAIVAIEDVLIEGRRDFMEKQIEQAATDDQVKAVVGRII